MKITKTKFLGWDCLMIEDDNKRIIFTKYAGGRVLYYGSKDFNILYETIDNPGKIIELPKEATKEEIKKLRKELGWLNYGGYKVWLAPQYKWGEGLPPFLDLDSGIYEIQYYEKQNGDVVVLLSSPIDRETGIQIKKFFEIKKDSNEVNIEISIEKENDEFDWWGIWNVCEVKKPVNIKIKDAKLLKTEEIFKYDEEVLEKNIIFNEEKNEFDIKIENIGGFKLYFLTQIGELISYQPIYEKERYIKFIQKFDTFNTRYPHDSNIEIYSDKERNFVELEIHSPLFTFTKENKKFNFKLKWDFEII